jgi:hypothetical protein
MWSARNKNDLIIEVWEKLDCESVGAAEIEAIEVAVGEQFGRAAVDSPMVVARLLADEGADLRHSEIMDLYVRRASDRPYEAALRNIIRLDSLSGAESTIWDLENLRRKYLADNDKEGLRLVNETARGARATAAEMAAKQTSDPLAQQTGVEIGQWLTVWLQTPEIFADWLALRRRSAEFTDIFGNEH